MPFDLTIPTEPTGIAVQRHTGDTTLEELDQVASELMDRYDAQGFAGLLMDVRTSRPLFSPADLIGVIDKYYPRLPRGFPLAYVLHERNHEIEQMIIETLAFNHGHRVRFFTELHSARVWLEGQALP